MYGLNEDGDGEIEDDFERFGDAADARRVMILMLSRLKMRMGVKIRMAVDVGGLKLRRGGAVRIV